MPFPYFRDVTLQRVGHAPLTAYIDGTKHTFFYRKKTDTLT